MPNSNAQSIVKGSAVILTSQLISGFITSIYAIYILKKLQPGDYGAYTVYLAITLIILTLQNLRLDDAITRFVRKPYSESSVDIFKISVTVVFIASAIICFILTFFASDISRVLFHDLKYTNFLKIMFVSTTLMALFSPFRGLIYGLKRFTHLAVIEASVIGVNVLVGFILLMQGYGIIGVAFGLLAGNFIGLLFFIIVSIPELKFLRKGRLNKSETGSLFHYSLPLAAQVTIGMVGLNLDRVILSGMKGVEFAAVQGLIIALMGFIDMIIFTVTRVLFPFMKDEFDKRGIESIQGFYHRMIKYYFLIALLPLPLIVVSSKELLILVAREEYVPYAGLLWFASILAMLRGWGRANGNVIMTTKDTHVLLKVSIIALFLSLILNYYLIAAFGVIGANISLMLIIFFRSTAISYFLWKKRKIMFDIRKILRLLVAMFIPILLVLIFIYAVIQLNPSYDNLRFKLSAVAASYALMMFFILKMGIIDDFEKKIIKSIVSRIL